MFESLKNYTAFPKTAHASLYSSPVFCVLLVSDVRFQTIKL